MSNTQQPDFSPLVSVIVTTYHGADVIERAVRSVLAQTYTPLEIIVVDDNGVGTDEQKQTQQIVESFGDAVVYLPHEINKNGSAARNTGIRYAHGEYIALLDDDDLFLPDKIQKQMQRLAEKGADYGVCYTGLNVHFPDGRVTVQCPTAEGELHIRIMKRGIQAPSSVLLFRRELALQIGGFDESFRRHQDWEFLDRLSAVTKIAAVSEPLIERIICKRNSAKNAEQYKNNRLYYLNAMEPYLHALPQDVQKEIYTMHYHAIAAEYLKEGNFAAALSYARKGGSVLRFCRSAFHSAVVRIIQLIGRRK